MNLLNYIYIKGNPSRVTAQQKGERIVAGSYIQHYEKDKIKAMKHRLAFDVRRFRPSEPYNEPLAVFIYWAFETKDKKKIKNIGKPTKPDLDNLAKSVLDVLTQQKFWKDDALIVNLNLMKIWVPVGEGNLTIEIYKDPFDNFINQNIGG